VQIPKGALLDKIEDSYGPLITRVRCGLCGTPHKKGFIVVFREHETAERKRTLIRHICGKREFKEIWSRVLARHKAEVRSEEIRAALREFLKTAEVIEPQLLALLPGLQARKVVRDTLLIDARGFMRECASACRGSSEGKIGHHY
jgi:hypothetical protein